MTLRHVAIFDAEYPTGIAFIRTLGRAKVPHTIFSHLRWPAGRLSRWSGAVLPAPNVLDVDAFAGWLTDAIADGRIDLVAPTSDYVAYAVAEAHERLGITAPGQPSPEAVRRCLFKDVFAARMAEAGFPTPPSAEPQSLDEADVAAAALGYPVVLKPRSHVGVGLARGAVAHTPDELTEAFRPYELVGGHASLGARNADVSLPILQRYFPPTQIDVVSIAGCLGRTGEVIALGHCRKLRAWPPGLGVGTRFESLGPQPFTEQGLDAVRGILGTGLFELEVLVDRETHDHWAIDLNPRAWGQLTLAAADGNDMPAQWYEVVTGVRIPRARPRRRPPRYWQWGVAYYMGALVSIVAGPQRLERARELARSLTEPRVGAVLDWHDPGPALALSSALLRHPARLARSFFRNRREELRSGLSG